MISLVELAVRVGGLKANGLPARNFEHHFVPTFVNTGKELVLFDKGNGKGAWPPLATFARPGLLQPAPYPLCNDYRMKCVVVNARSRAQAQGLSNSGSGGTERHSGRCDRDCPLASRQTTSRSILTACATQV